MFAAGSQLDDSQDLDHRRGCRQAAIGAVFQASASCVDTIAHRVCRHLVRQGWLEGEDESAFLSDRAGGDDGMDGLRMSSITYRIATG